MTRTDYPSACLLSYVARYMESSICSAALTCTLLQREEIVRGECVDLLLSFGPYTPG
jgi:hypothetical protein